MQTYSGKWMPRFNMLIFGLCGFGTFYFMVIVSIRRALEHNGYSPTLLIATLPFGLFGLLIGCYCLYAIADSFSVYRIDDNHIEKCGLGHAISLSWRAITAFHYKGQRNSDLTLRDDSGQSLKIRYIAISGLFLRIFLTQVAPASPLPSLTCPTIRLPTVRHTPMLACAPTTFSTLPTG